ncbi:hypothetical protein ACQKL6_06355 [Peribacillus sp. NPDC097197]|uniref:hypothetical protein n=1 Tax=Peribacillus sp. NPDC097197 TaxID=3390615 RepID=UPI003CFEB138
MNQKPYLQVTRDMFWMQFVWTLSFFGVMLLIHVIKITTSQFSEDEVSTFFASSSITSNIFMLVIGIISSSSFIKHYVGHGITRKDFFYGASLTSISLSIIIPLLSALVTQVISFIIKLADLPIVFQGYKSEHIDDGGNLISDMIQSVILTPIVELHSDPLLALLIFSLNVLTYYIVGWLIGAAFYRFGTIAGLGSIALGGLVLYIEDVLMHAGLAIGMYNYTFTMPLYVSVFVVLVIVGILLWLIRLFTKRVAIKV